MEQLSMGLAITTRDADGVMILAPAGMVMGAGTSDNLRQALMEQASAGRKRLLLDCSGITHIDSTGLGELINAYAMIARQGGAFKLLHPSQRFRDLLKITRLDSLLAWFDDEASALASFR
jgi:anti-sigma B factor antagonist